MDEKKMVPRAILSLVIRRVLLVIIISFFSL